MNSINESETKNIRKSANFTKDSLTDLSLNRFPTASSPETEEAIRRKTAGAVFLSNLISNTAPNASKTEDIAHDGRRKAPNATTLSNLINSAKNLHNISAPVSSKPTLTPMNKTDISNAVREAIDLELRKSANFESTDFSPKSISNNSSSPSKQPNFDSIDAIVKNKQHSNQVKFNVGLNLQFAPTFIDSDKKQSSMGISPGQLSNYNIARSPLPAVNSNLTSPNISPPLKKGGFSLSPPINVSQSIFYAYLYIYF